MKNKKEQRGDKLSVKEDMAERKAELSPEEYMLWLETKLEEIAKEYGEFKKGALREIITRNERIIERNKRVIEYNERIVQANDIIMKAMDEEES